MWSSHSATAHTLSGQSYCLSTDRLKMKQVLVNLQREREVTADRTQKVAEKMQRKSGNPKDPRSK